jgi:predicted CopG family antitoxin
MEVTLQATDAPLSFLDERQNRFVAIQRSTGKRMDALMSELCRLAPATGGELQEAVIERYGVDPDDARFLVDLAREADAEAVDRDKQALKQAFTYRDHEHDLWEVLLEDPDRPFFAPLRIVELPRFGAEGFVEECYYEKGALEPLARKYGGFDKWQAEAFERLLKRLEEEKSFDVIERLCTAVARRARSRFFAEQAGRNGKASEAWIEKFKEYALEAYDQAIAWLERIGRFEAAGRLAGQREAVREGRLPELPPVSDLRRMDETVFWELITRAGSGAETPDDRLEALERLLGTFKAADIKRFAALYAGFMRKLHHWNVWALAYAARDGCSDDSFMAFRTWLVLEGDPALVELAVADPAKAARRVPRNPELPDGTLLPLIEEAFLRRNGAPTEMPTIDNPKPKGREWPEDALETAHPDLVLHYGSAEARRAAS